jgi:quercetin dioxygenase-like cupin family protein
MLKMFNYLDDLLNEQTIPSDAIISKVIHKDEKINAVLFGFGADQELSEHTAAVPVIIQVLQGEARITVGEEVIEAKDHSWLRLDARVPHSVYAKTPLVMLLTMLK